MKALRILSILLVPSLLSNAQAKDNFVPTKTKPIVVAVIDTGINPALAEKVSLCKYGSKDFTGKGLTDNHGHGSHIAGIVDSFAKGTDIRKVGDVHANYCQIILKYFDNVDSKTNVTKTTRLAFKWAIALKVDVINYSAGGFFSDSEEEALIKEALDKGIRVIVAAGNDGVLLGKPDKTTMKGAYYPAMYDDSLFVVGNLDADRKPASTSNYGPMVNIWELGTDVLSFCAANTDKLCYMTGTSQATAVRTGKIVRSLLRQRN